MQAKPGWEEPRRSPGCSPRSSVGDVGPGGIQNVARSPRVDPKPRVHARKRSWADDPPPEMTAHHAEAAAPCVLRVHR
jgi:hypothetical protein